MRTRTFVAVGGMVAAFALVVGCGTAVDGSASAQSTLTPSPEPPPATTTVTVDPPIPAKRPTVTVTVHQPAPAPAPETRGYTPLPLPPVTFSPTVSDTDIRAEVGDAVSVVDQYWKDLFGTWRDKQGKPVYWRTPPLYRGNGFYDTTVELAPSCYGDSVAGASFCPTVDGSGWMSWDMNFFRPFAATGNDVVYYMVVAHETAHAAQVRFIYDGEGPATTDDTSVDKETQADCIAGATLGKSVLDGHLIVEDGDQQEIRDVMTEVGDYENSHGTPEQRYSAFERGYQSADIESCLGHR